jgi:CIC family chloride channel protein
MQGQNADRPFPGDRPERVASDSRERSGETQLAETKSNKIAHILQRLNPSETQVLVASGIAVGIGAGVGAVFFRYLIQFFTYVFFDVVEPALETVFGSAAVIFIPALGGLIFGPLIYFFAREAKGHGVPEVMNAVALRGGRIRPIVAVVKSLASALCIGSGGSVGREGPIVQIGSALGSTFGQVLKMSDDRVRTLVACGAAGGIAATFNAPIAGVFFALEIILGEFTTRAFGIVVLASLTASVIGRAAFGDVSAFPVPSYELVSVTELPLYALLAALAAFVGFGFTRTLYWFEDRFDELPMKEYLKPVPGGLMVGLLGLGLPQIFGVGYPAMEKALHGEYVLGILSLLILAKILAVSLTIGSGGSGGVFAPSLFVGAMLGTSFGSILHSALPNSTAPAGAYGLVGMAAVFAAAAHAPITAVIILFELTGDYKIILPLMGAVVISTLVSEALSKETIYTLKLRRQGIDLLAGRDVDLLRSIQVFEAMTTSVPAISQDHSVVEASEMLGQSREHALVLVNDAGELDGVVSTGDVAKALLENKPGQPVSSIATRPVVTAFPDETLSQALRRMSVRDIRQLPIVRRSRPKRVLGMLRRNDISRAYSQAMIERMETEHQRPVKPSELRGTQVVEIPVTPSSPFVGVKLSELDLPRDVLVIAIERGEETVIPRGDTELEAGDRMLFLVQHDRVVAFHEHLASKQDSTGG